MGRIKMFEASRRAGKSWSKGTGKVSFPSESLMPIYHSVAGLTKIVFRTSWMQARALVLSWLLPARNHSSA